MGSPSKAQSDGGDRSTGYCDTLILQLIEDLPTIGRPIIVGLSGPQGSGKSTAASRIADTLTKRCRPAAVLSLDDFYLPRAERLELARSVHPLLLTRGVPGTHDVDLAKDCLLRLGEPAAMAPVQVPRFDKLADDRADRSDWRPIGRPLEVIIFEGWCVGARPQPECELAIPVNDLERNEDPEGVWRHFVNAQLEGPYHELFGMLDAVVAFRAQSFAIVEQWRAEQEASMAASTRRQRAMNGPELRRFISHFERLTRWMDAQPSADLLIDIDDDRLALGHCRKDANEAGS